jgi:hypothetical protein
MICWNHFRIYFVKLTNAEEKKSTLEALSVKIIENKMFFRVLNLSINISHAK